MSYPKVQSHRRRPGMSGITVVVVGTLAGEERPPAPPDRGDPDLLQLFVQGRLGSNEARELVARVGRQVIHYGSGRLVAFREGAHQRFFDLGVGYTHHFVGGSLAAVGGHDVDYFQTTLRIQF